MFDVLVIGGGVNGVGVARDCALRGLSVMLVEKKDFSAGTSWASSGMIHGGIRYMESDMWVTRKSCLDAGYIRKIAPHMVFRIPFLFPQLRGGLMARLMFEGVHAYFKAYNTFNRLKGGKPATRLTPDEVRRIEPLVEADILGGVTMDEWGIDVPRLCIANVRDAADNGAEVRNHTRVEHLLMDGKRVIGAKLRDEDTGAVEEVRAKIVCNTAGVWAPTLAKTAGCESIKLRPGKGIHLIFDRRITNHAVVANTIDNRGVFLMPHENTSLIGTTDDDYYGDPDDLRVTQDEVEYLLQALETVIPSIRDYRVIRVIAGLRPTLHAFGPVEDKLSRDHKVYDHEQLDGVEGFVSLAGGKLAAYREMAEDATDAVCEKLGNRSPCLTHKQPLPGGESTPDPFALAGEYGMDPYLVSRLVFRHGSVATKILETTKEHPGWKAVVDEDEPVTEAELRWCIRHEWVRRLGDLSRRTKLGDGPSQGAHSLMHAAMILADEKGLDSEEAVLEVMHWQRDRWREKSPVMSGLQRIQEMYNMTRHLSAGGMAKLMHPAMQGKGGSR